MPPLYLNQLSEVLSRHAANGLVGLKSELESEGIRLSELTTLNLLAKTCNLKTALKIGGSEARSDLLTAFDQLTDFVIAPMIETPYAAKKCIDLYAEVSSRAQHTPPHLLINIETITALRNLDEIIATSNKVVKGIVFGRVDFTLSSNLTRSDILSETVCQAALHTSKVCKDNNLEFVLGGGVSVDSIDFLRKLRDIRLDRFETRKCILSADCLSSSYINEILQDCVLVELLWLKSKSSSYNSISTEDHARISMLEKRHLYNIATCE